MVEKQHAISKAHLAAARAVDQLRRQLGIVFDDAQSAVPIEGVTTELLQSLRPSALLITGARARSLGLAIEKNVRAALIDAQNLSLSQLLALADPLAEAAALPALTLLPVTPAHETLLRLVKHAALLPALLIAPSTPPDWVRIDTKDAEAYWSEPLLDILPLAQARLPTQDTEQTTLTCFRERYGTSVHLALTVGDIGKTDAPLARVHSSCLTGDILGSLRCDCGDQLKLALATLAREGGVLLYLHQEGRGIGLANKLRAYALQEKGVDTYDANVMLGFEEDERDFAVASGMLRALGVKRIRLLTNNPLKLDHLKRHGIDVAARVPLVAEGSPHSHAYLDAKAKKSGHLF